MPKPGFRADTLLVDVERERDGVVIGYAADTRPPATIRLPVGGISEQSLHIVVTATAVYLGSLCLAAEIRINRPVPSLVLDDFSELAEMVYDIRRWRDALPLTGPPLLRAPTAPRHAGVDAPLDHRKSVVLWSGGKDSTLAIVTLRANGFLPHPLHASVNVGSERQERDAIGRLASLLDVREVDEVLVEHPDFLDFSRSFADAWDDFPLSNRVPFGRDLLLAALAIPIALRRGAAHISMGHDHDCRTAEVMYEGRRIPRNDLESSHAAIIFERIVRRHVHPRLGLLPPVANIAELRILRDMLVDYPHLMAETSFCFWGRNCGRCGKCMRYYLAARLFQPGLLTFETNPLSAGACPELAEMLADPSTLFQKEVMVLLGRLSERGDIRPGEDELERFRATLFPEIESHLDAWEDELLAQHPDPQLPDDFWPASAFGEHNLASSEPADMRSR